MKPVAIAAAVVALVLAAPPVARAAEDDRRAEPKPSAAHLDVEADPTAFVLGGGSAHVGLGYRRVRLDLGAFAMDVPAFVHGNDGFSSSFVGGGAKLQVFVSPHGQPRGAFVGADAGFVSFHVTKDGTELDAHQMQLSIGVNGGYRFELPWDLYVTPWLGIGWSPTAKDIALGGATYRSSPITIFPAVHVGYRFM